MTDGPFFSVVVPTFSRPHRLAACLRALSRMWYPKERFEVVVVDDGSLLPLDDMVSLFRADLHVKLLRARHGGPGAARNAGARVARGRFLAFTDDDCEPAEDWLSQLETACEANTDCAVGGSVLNALPGNLYSTATQLIHDHAYRYYDPVRGQPHFFGAANLAVPAARFLEIGGFDERDPGAGGEDRELCDRWLHRGLGLVAAPRAKVRHEHQLTLRAFWHQHCGYGRGAVRFHDARAGRGGPPFGPDLAFEIGLLRQPFIEARAGRAISLATLVILARLGYDVGFCLEWVRRRSSRPAASW